MSFVPRLVQRLRMQPDRGRSAVFISVSDRGKCLLKRERAQVDEGLGKNEEIGPLLEICADEGFPRGG